MFAQLIIFLMIFQIYQYELLDWPRATKHIIKSNSTRVRNKSQKRIFLKVGG